MKIQLRNFNAKPPALPACSANELSKLDFDCHANVDTNDMGNVGKRAGFNIN